MIDVSNTKNLGVSVYVKNGGTGCLKVTILLQIIKEIDGHFLHFIEDF